MFFTDRQDFSLPVGSYIFCSEAFAFESIFPLIQIKHGLYLSTVKAVAMLDLDVLPFGCGFRETPNIVDKLVPVKPNLLVYINLFRIRQVDMAEKQGRFCYGSLQIAIGNQPVQFFAVYMWLRIRNNQFPFSF